MSPMLHSFRVQKLKMVPEKVEKSETRVHSEVKNDKFNKNIINIS